jgi:large subunit ribosomal protein L19
MNANDILKAVEAKYMIHSFPDVEIGDTVGVHVRIQEGDKSRIQVYTGIVISRKGGAGKDGEATGKGGTCATFTVRRLVGAEGVERTFPVHCPAVEKVEIIKKGDVRRSKLYFLRDRIGKATKVKERRKKAE